MENKYPEPRSTHQDIWPSTDCSTGGNPSGRMCNLLKMYNCNNTRDRGYRKCWRYCRFEVGKIRRCRCTVEQESHSLYSWRRKSTVHTGRGRLSMSH